MLQQKLREHDFEAVYILGTSVANADAKMSLCLRLPSVKLSKEVSYSVAQANCD